MKTKKLKSVRELWEDYARVALPTSDPGTTQFREAKSVFYVAIYAFIGEMMVLGEAEMSEDDGANVLQNYHVEAYKWIQEDLQDRVERFKLYSAGKV